MYNILVHFLHFGHYIFFSTKLIAYFMFGFILVISQLAFVTLLMGFLMWN